jgi:hypothetical protein
MNGCRGASPIDKIKKAIAPRLNGYLGTESKELKCCPKPTNSPTQIRLSPFD